MNLRTPWIAVLLALASGLFLWFGIMDGMPGIRMVGYSLAFAVAVVGPVLAAVRLGKEAAASPVFRRRLLVLLAVPTVASLAFAWLLMGGTIHFFMVFFAGLGVAAVSVAAAAASAAFHPDRPGRAGLDTVARSLWTLALAGGIFCLSLPLGMGLQSRAVERAKRWVEAAATEVRAVEKASGHLPASLRGILDRLDPPPRYVPPDGGFSSRVEQGEFEFTLDDPSQFLPGWWIYEGKTGTWRQEFF